jgi:hypothetical protein
MPEIDMSFPHNLPQNEALTRIKKLLGEVKSEHADKISDLNEKWSGHSGQFSFKAFSFSVSGTLEVSPSAVRLNGKLPFAAGLFKDQIEDTIRQRATNMLS